MIQSLTFTGFSDVRLVWQVSLLEISQSKYNLMFGICISHARHKPIYKLGFSLRKYTNLIRINYSRSQKYPLYNLALKNYYLEDQRFCMNC